MRTVDWTKHTLQRNEGFLIDSFDFSQVLCTVPSLAHAKCTFRNWSADVKEIDGYLYMETKVLWFFAQHQRPILTQNDLEKG